MNVLHVYKTYFPDSFGGVPEAIRQLANGTGKHGVNSEVFTISPQVREQRFAFEKHHVIQASSNFEIFSTPFSIDAVSKFKIYSKKFDLIHYHYPYPFGDVLKLLGANRKPSIVTYHSDIVRQRISKIAYAPVQTLFLNSVDRIICTSPSYAKSSRVLKRYQDKVDIIPLGLENSDKKHAMTSEMKVLKADLPDSYFLFLGVLRNYKGVDTLVRAMKGVDKKIIIAGGGPELGRMKTLAQRLKADNIIFLGPVNEAQKALLLDGCYGLVLPSHLRSEAFGLVLLEAAMRGKPLISTELGTGTSYANKHNETGLVVPPKDVRALQDALDFLSNNPGKVRQMGEAAKQRYDRLFTAELMCSRYAEIYKDVLTGCK